MREFSFLVGLLGLLTNLHFASAQQMQGNFNPAQGSSVLSNSVQSRPANYFGHIRVEGMQYLTPIEENPDLTTSQLVSARLTLVKEAPVMEAGLDLSGGTFISTPHSHFVVHEAFVSSSRRHNTVAYVGRKKMNWSDLDQRWQLGMWQPKFSYDTLRPEDQGLTGLFVDYKRKNFEILGFATPVYIPNMGPEIREENGGLVSNSRWYRAPSRDFEFGRTVNTINYDLDIPEYEKLVMNGGAAIMMRVGDTESGLWARTSYGYLPVNELLLKRMNFKSASEDIVDVTVTPDVAYHALASADMGYSFTDKSRLVVSYLQDSPIDKIPDGDWRIQRLEPMQAYSVALDFAVQDLMSFPITLGLEYFKVFGGGITDIRENGEVDDITMFENRLNFTNTFSVRAEGEVARLWSKPFVTRLRYLYDYDQQGSVFQTEFLYYPRPQWALVAGTDILGVQNENSSSTTFINQYRANDRVYGGMTYVF